MWSVGRDVRYEAGAFLFHESTLREWMGIVMAGGEIEVKVRAVWAADDAGEDGGRGVDLRRGFCWMNFPFIRRLRLCEGRPGVGVANGCCSRRWRR